MLLLNIQYYYSTTDDIIATKMHKHEKMSSINRVQIEFSRFVWNAANKAICCGLKIKWKESYVFCFTNSIMDGNYY